MSSLYVLSSMDSMQIVGRNGIEYHIPEVYTGPKNTRIQGV